MKRSLHTSCGRVSVILLTALGLAVGLPQYHTLSAPIEETRIANLEARVARLELHVRELEQQRSVRAPEPAPITTVRAPVTVPGNWQSKDNWARVQSGMSFQQVAQILGRPVRTDMYSSGDGGTWYYEGYAQEAGTTISGKIAFSGRQVMCVFTPVW
jgi:hypothetical protein